MAKKKSTKGTPASRSRISSGQFRDKRDDTLMGSIEKKYNRDFHVRSDMELGNFLKQNNIASLNDLIRSNLGKKK